MVEIVTSVQLDDLALSVHRSPADGSPGVLLLHGLASDAKSTWGQPGWFRALERAGLSWVAPDLLGHGASSTPHDAALYHPDLLVKGILAVLDSVGAARVHVLAYSMGARLALYLATAAPSRIGRVVLGGFSPGPHESSALDLVLAHLPSGVDAEAMHACADGVLTGPALNSAAVMSPVLLVAGSQDPFGVGLERFAGGFRDAKFLHIEGRGHMNALGASGFKQAAISFLKDGVSVGT